MFKVFMTLKRSLIAQRSVQISDSHTFSLVDPFVPLQNEIYPFSPHYCCSEI